MGGDVGIRHSPFGDNLIPHDTLKLSVPRSDLSTLYDVFNDAPRGHPTRSTQRTERNKRFNISPEFNGLIIKGIRHAPDIRGGVSRIRIHTRLREVEGRASFKVDVKYGHATSRKQG